MKLMIPENWEKVRICDIGECITGTTPKTKVKEYYDKQEYDFIAPADIGINKCIYESEKKISKKGLSVSRKLPKNSICCVCIGSSIGKVGITYKELSSTNQQINAIICKQQYFHEFIFYLLLYYRNYWKSFSTFGPVPILSKGKFEEIPIPITTNLKEQRKIAYILATVQKAIEKQEEIIKTINELKKTMMQKLFTEGLHGEPQKETEIGLVPENWKVVKLEDIAFDFKGGGTPSTRNVEYWNGNIYWTTSKWLNESIYLLDGEKRITTKGLENSATNLLPPNNLLISTRVTNGKVAINKIPIAYSQDLTGIWIDHKKYCLEFIAYQIKTNKIQTVFEKQKRGATIKGITREDLKSIKLAVPGFDIQKEIAKILLNLDSKISIIDKKRTILSDLFKSNLNQLMTGQLRVNDIDFPNMEMD